MKRVLPLCALLFALGALPTSAILDTNSNGLSDLWERAYNGGDLFSSINPLADDDGDGWTNEQEAAAGTSPFDANAPDGIVRPQTNHIPEVLGVSPEVIQVIWPQIPGKVYTLLFSPDLIDWLPVGEAFIGSEIEQVYNFPLTQIEGQPPPPDKLFWRVSIEDVDSDGDGLTDAEEHELGTDPDNSETLAGYPDMWLVENYLPDLLNDELSSLDLNGDPDLDGLTNAQEKKLGTNPAVSDNPGIVQDSISNGEFSHPLIGSGKRSEVTDPDWDYWEGLPADEYGKTSWTAVVGTNIEYQIGTPKEGCDQYVELKAHPGYNYGIKQQVGTRIGVTYLLVFDCRTRPGTDAANNNFSVVIDNGEPKPITFAEHTGWISKAISFKATDVITHISLVPDNNQNDTMGCLVDNVSLVSVEIVNHEKKPVSELVVADMEESLTLEGYLVLDEGVTTGFAGDPDRFYVRMPNLPGNHTVTVKLSTVENPDASYNDNPTELKLYPVDGGYESKSQALVSGAIDAEIATLENITPDNPDPISRHKRTHNVQLGGKVRITDLVIDGTALPMDLKIPVLVKQTVQLNFVVIDDAGTPNITDELKSANEIFASTGIKLEKAGEPVTKPPLPPLPGQSSASELNDRDISDLGRYISHYGTTNTIDDIHVFYVKQLFYLNENDARMSDQGYAIIEKSPGTMSGEPMPSAKDTGDANNVFIGNPRASFMVLAHEVCHVLTNDIHYGTNYASNVSNRQESHNLMSGTTRNSSETDTTRAKKRIYEMQRQMIFNHWFTP